MGSLLRSRLSLSNVHFITQNILSVSQAVSVYGVNITSVGEQSRLRNKHGNFCQSSEQALPRRGLACRCNPQKHTGLFELDSGIWNLCTRRLELRFPAVNLPSLHPVYRLNPPHRLNFIFLVLLKLFISKFKSLSTLALISNLYRERKSGWCRSRLGSASSLMSKVGSHVEQYLTATRHSSL